MSVLLSTLLLAVSSLAPAPPSGLGSGAGGQLLSVEEALELAFPECAIERATCYLSEAEEERARKLAGFDDPDGIGRIARPYLATRAGKPVGTAYFDAHRVRTKNEILMIVLDPDERITRVEVLAFAEPVDYLPRGSFYAQFQEKRLGDPLEVGRGIRGVTGATLSARAACEAARRTLAVHRVLGERTPPAPAPGEVPSQAPRGPAPR